MSPSSSSSPSSPSSSSSRSSSSDSSDEDSTWYAPGSFDSLCSSLLISVPFFKLWMVYLAYKHRSFSMRDKTHQGASEIESGKKYRFVAGRQRYGVQTQGPCGDLRPRASVLDDKHPVAHIAVLFEELIWNSQGQGFWSLLAHCTLHCRGDVQPVVWLVSKDPPGLLPLFVGSKGRSDVRPANLRTFKSTGGARPHKHMFCARWMIMCVLLVCRAGPVLSSPSGNSSARHTAVQPDRRALLAYSLAQLLVRDCTRPEQAKSTDGSRQRLQQTQSTDGSRQMLQSGHS